MGTRSPLRVGASLAANKRFHFTKQLLDAAVDGGVKVTVIIDGWAFPWLMGLLAEFENPDNYEWDFTGLDWPEEDKTWMREVYPALFAEWNDNVFDSQEVY
jgi:hypothetical protein